MARCRAVLDEGVVGADYVLDWTLPLISREEQQQELVADGEPGGGQAPDGGGPGSRLPAAERPSTARPSPPPNAVPSLAPVRVAGNETS